MILNKNISIKIEPRPDGGIRIWSPQIKGLVLSGPDPAKIMAAVWPAIVALLESEKRRRAAERTTREQRD